MSQARMQELLAVIAQSKDMAQRVNDVAKQAEAALIELMESAGVKTVTRTTEDGDELRGTLVKAERVVMDEAGIIASLSAPQRKMVTKMVLDKAMLEAAVATGIVDAETVASHSEIKQNKPYVRVGGSTPSSEPIADVSEAMRTIKSSIRDMQGKIKPAARKRVVKAPPKPKG